MSKTTKLSSKWERYLPVRRTKLRTYLILCGIIIGVLDLNEIEMLPFTVGAVLMAVAALVHVWAKGHLDKNKSLTRSGPYRWVRDPFHLANFFLDLGMCLIINQWVFTVVFMTFWIVAYRHRLGEEHEQLLEIFGDEYRDYAARIPRMIPWRKPLDKATYDTPFTVRHMPIWEGKVCTRLFRFASYPYLLFAAAQAGNIGTDVWWPGTYPTFYWAIFGFLFFYVMGEAAARVTSKRKSLLPVEALREPVALVISVIYLGILLALDWFEPAIGVSEKQLSGTGMTVLIAVLVILALLAGKSLWQSYRFRRLAEAGWLVLIGLFSALPWLAIVPLAYYIPAFLYGAPSQSQANVEHVFLQDEGLLNAALYGFCLLLLSAVGMIVIYL